MYFVQTISVFSLCFTAAIAADTGKISVRSLVERQDQSFQPGTNFGSGATCADAFGSGFVQCGTGNKCFNPSGGESCCSNSYPCPSGSFCLIDGYCCPNGIDPQTCAINNGVSLPAGFTPGGATTPASTPPASTPTTTPTTTTPPPVYTPPGGSNYTYHPSGSLTGSSSVTYFTGGAVAHSLAGGAGLAVAFFGFLGNLI
ncbi:MAG: hypothetical protein Q9160_005732 [Pyrenula sp. 1 TL-2023]